jgi:hypothetical protein
MYSFTQDFNSQQTVGAVVGTWPTSAITAAPQLLKDLTKSLDSIRLTKIIGQELFMRA